jgi:uncharacterized membrane protein YfcA
MSLKAFHIVFVTLSSLLAFGFAGWVLRAYTESGARSDLLSGIGAAIFGVALIAYGFWFWRKIRTREEEEKRRRKLMRPVTIVLTLWMLSDQAAWACSVCYGNAEGPMLEAARGGVYLLFALIGAVQVAFAVFFVSLWRRSRRFRETVNHAR